MSGGFVKHRDKWSGSPGLHVAFRMKAGETPRPELRAQWLTERGRPPRFFLSALPWGIVTRLGRGRLVARA